MVSLEEQVVGGQTLEQSFTEESAQQRRYPALDIDEVRAKLRGLGVSDPDRLLPPQYYGEFNTCGG